MRLAKNFSERRLPMNRNCEDRKNGFICTRDKGHKGIHIATGTRCNMIAAWGDGLYFFRTDPLFPKFIEKYLFEEEHFEEELPEILTRRLDL